MKAPIEALAVDGVIRLPSELDSSTSAPLWRAYGAFSPVPQLYQIDASALTRCTGTGIALMQAIEARIRNAGGICRIEGLPEAIAAQLDSYRRQLEPQTASDAAPEGKVSLPIAAVTELGRQTHHNWRQTLRSIAYIGELTVCLLKVLRRPGLLRWRDFWQVCETAGVNALPVVMLLGFLLGLILAFQSAIPMKMFGAQIYVASLLGISLVRELGPLITAIMLTGRSGSAFAAEIGTMQVNEELDALRTMGLNPLQLLAVPRVLAGILVMPVLTLFANVAGLLGGLIVMRMMGFSFSLYCTQLQHFVSYGDLLGGLAKAMVFGLLVAAVGCLRGLDTGRDAAAVGTATTSSVVSGIILIAVADGLFAVLFYIMGW